MISEDAEECIGCSGQIEQDIKCRNSRDAAKMLEMLSCKMDCKLMIRGHNVSLSRLQEVLAGLEDIRASYRVCVDKEHNLDVVDVYVAPDEPVETFLVQCEEETVKHKVAKAVRNVLGVTPRVSIIEHLEQIKQGKKWNADDGERVIVLDHRKTIHFV